MKQHGGLWLPDSDQYFGEIFEREGGFQIDRLKIALSYVTSWDYAIDGGAHVGTWSIEMAKQFNHVLSFEPAPDTFKCLCSNTKEFPNVEQFNEALGDRQGLVNSMDDITRPGNTGSRFVEQNSNGKIPMDSIDNLDLPSLGFLKLDLEGAEYLALKGAEGTICEHKPVVFVEIKKGMAERFNSDMYAPLNFLKELGAKEVDRIKSDYIYMFV
ncbi:MAG: FkbM family methyltransferase [Candidatus Odinarchaeia archaeon]